MSADAIERRAAPNDRRSLVVACAVLVLFSLNFGAYRVFGDGVDYYSFVQRLFGERKSGSGYNFGVGVLNAPFFAVGKLVHSIVGNGRLGEHAEPASITIASIFFVLVTLICSAWLVRKLELPHPSAIALCAVFGSPVWYYASFSPSYTHAADSAVFSIAAVALWHLLETRDLRWRLLTGAACGLSISVRPFNAAMVLALIVGLVSVRRLSDAAWIAAAATAAFGLLLTLPLALGTGLSKRADGEAVYTHTVFAPLNPLRMLFSLHRGLFLWTPLTAIAAIGVVLFLRRPDPHRLYVALLTAMVLGLLCAYTSFGVWDAGWSFSARYLAAPVPLYAIGVAAAISAVQEPVRRKLLEGIVGLAVLFSVFLGMNHAFGAAQSDGANNIVGFYASGKRTPSDFIHLTWSYSRVRHIVDKLPS